MRLTEGDYREIDDRLAAHDAFLRERYPGERAGRQPVHTVYVPADRYTPDLHARWGIEATRLLEEHGGIDALCTLVGLPDDLSARVAPRVVGKLQTEPVEDLRVDFEDGYGRRSDEQEDADVVRVARSLGSAGPGGPAFVGIRFKCLEAPTRRRGLRTLDLFLTTLVDAGGLPDGLRLTLPKVSTTSQVEVMVAACTAFEGAAGLPEGTLGFEIQVETPPIVLAADGRAEIAAALHAGAGRVTGLHYGTYDYSASLEVAAEQQSMAHPAADHAKLVMQAAAAETGVQLSDGSTNVLPVGGPDQVRHAWRLHHDLVRRSLERAYYQGWDLHPGQLPTRYLATFAFFAEGFSRASARLRAYLQRDEGGVLDEPATARALARYVGRGVTCGAVGEDELLGATGLDAAALARLAQPKSDTEGLRAPISPNAEEHQP
jgi:citrate lyase beta subunit